MSNLTKSEKWFGKKQNDLTKEELLEFWRLDEMHKKLLKKDREIENYKKVYRNTNDRIIEKEKQIADLEAKLAESEKNYAELFCRNTELETLHSQKTALVNFYKDSDLVKENAELKQQLAEKKKEIEQLKKFDDLNKTFFDLFRTAFKEPDKVDDLFNTLKTMQEKQDQDKISFAVEQLEQLRHDVWINQADDGYTDMQVDLYELNDVIDVRIMQIKEGK